MDDIPILNSQNNHEDINNSENTIEEMLFNNRLGLNIDGLTNIESDALKNQMDIDNDNHLYEIIKIKEEVINTLKTTNYNLTNIIFNFEDKINKIDKSISSKLSDISTKKDISLIMDNNKKLVNLINKERENSRKLNYELNKSNNELSILKNTYRSLNKIYISNFQNDSPAFSQIDFLKKEIELLKNANNNLLELKNSLKCKICYDKYVNCLIEPCGHLSTCTECINRLRDFTAAEEIKCPICNGFISSCKNIYLPI